MYSYKLVNNEFESVFDLEEELIDRIINKKLSPLDFTIFKVLNPKDYKKYNDSLLEIEKSINNASEKSKIRLKQLQKQKEISSFLLKNKVTIFDSEIEKEKENIENNLKRLESCK